MNCEDLRHTLCLHVIQLALSICSRSRSKSSDHAVDISSVLMHGMGAGNRQEDDEIMNGVQACGRFRGARNWIVWCGE